jgi:hypothetical protein
MNCSRANSDQYSAASESQADSLSDNHEHRIKLLSASETDFVTIKIPVIIRSEKLQLMKKFACPPIGERGPPRHRSAFQSLALEQRLKEFMIRSIYHQDIGVCMPKGFSGSGPGSPAPIITILFIHCLIHAARSRKVICDLTMARMSRFSRIRPWCSCVSRSTTSTIAQAKSSARTT